MRRLLLLALAVTALVASGCGSDDDSGADDGAAAGPAATETAPAEEQPTAPAEEDDAAEREGTTIKLDDSQFGQVIFDEDGQAIYLFDKETSDTSECYDDCAAEWPPVLTEGEPQAADGVDASLLGTTERDDGTTQVTYNDHPLYFYAHEGRDEVRCHNVPGFGGIWLALGADGNRIS
ncbi:MAG: hypothetical protein WD844_15070 [Thermoleophilaceae bacterium]